MSLQINNAIIDACTQPPFVLLMEHAEWSREGSADVCALYVASDVRSKARAVKKMPSTHRTLRHAGWERMRLGTTQLRKRFLRGESIPGVQRTAHNGGLQLCQAMSSQHCWLF